MWTWFKTKTPPPVADDGLDSYNRRPLWGQYQNGFNVFGPYRRPVQDATGRGGQIVLRQLRPLSPNYVFPQQWTPVSITGRGSELTGDFSSMGLIDTSNGAGAANVLANMPQTNRNINRVN